MHVNPAFVFLRASRFSLGKISCAHGGFLPIWQRLKFPLAKRFKLSSTGKLIRRTPGFRHLLAAKSTKSKRRASRDKLVADGQAKQLKRALPFGL